MPDLATTIKHIVGDVLKDVKEETTPLIKLMVQQNELLAHMNNKLALIHAALDDTDEDVEVEED